MISEQAIIERYRCFVLIVYHHKNLNLTLKLQFIQVAINS